MMRFVKWPVFRRARPWRGRRRSAVVFAALLVAALTVTGCGSSGGARSDSGSRANVQARPGAGTGAAAQGSGSTPGGATGGSTGKPAGTDPAAAAAYLVRTATLSVRTPDVERQLAKAREYAVRAGGYTGDENTTVDATGRAESSVQLRVPVASYDQVLTELAGLGTLLSREASVQDVTGQVVDVTSRVATQRASVARVRALMDQARQLGDIVSLESELSTRESALEALEAQQASLRSQTDLATVTLRLTEPSAARAAPKPAKRHDGFWTAVGHALRDGWHAFYVTMRVALIVVAVALPFAAAALLGWYGYRVVRRRLPGMPRRTAVYSSPRGPGRGPRSARRSAGAPFAIPLPHQPREGEQEPEPEPEPPAGE